MSYPKGNLDGIQLHYSVHNISREIPKEEINDDEKKNLYKILITLLLIK